MQPKKQLSFNDVLRFAAKYWIQQPWKLGIIVCILTSASILETYLPTALANFLGVVREQASKNVIYFFLMIFLGVYFLQAMLFGVTYIIYNSFETRLFTSLLNDAFEHVYRLPERFFADTFTGSIITKINRARQKIEVFEDQVIIRIFPTFLILIGTTGFLALHFPALAILMVIYLTVMLVASAFLVSKISGVAQGKYAAAQDHFGAHLADSISGIATTKAYAKEQDEFATYSKITTDLRDKNFKAYYLSNLAALAQRVLLVGMLAILLGGGTWYLFQGKANVEGMAYLVLAYTIMQSYIRELGENIKNIVTSSYDLHAVILLLQESPEVSENLIAELTIKKGAIVFDNVTFTYPGKSAPVFKNFSVSIKAGERVALVGHSGSGKTSFIRLLQCMYPIQGGCISIDGQDITKGSRFSLRNSIALVPQDPILFHRTLRENIAYANPAATFEEIQAAARQAYIADFIGSLPLKYETLVGERGIKLSGGERQRIAIARAILANRPILILDEATSSLDSASEKAIQNGLHLLTHGRTSIMIAHRLSTILDADRIFVFDQGCIVEEGKHDDLIAKENGVYAGFFKLQVGDLEKTFVSPD
jgi:ATP-binding cassette, subfamily B, bacterial